MVVVTWVIQWGCEASPGKPDPLHCTFVEEVWFSDQMQPVMPAISFDLALISAK
jgi:hypothetical protein